MHRPTLGTGTSLATTGLATVVAGLCAATIGLLGTPVAAAPAPAPAPAEAQSTPDDGIPDVYFVPMRGQMGTDVHVDVYKDVVKDIKRVDPDLVVFVLNCQDVNTIFYLNDDNPVEASLLSLGEYRELIKLLHEELRDYRQVMYVEDSVGFSSLFALGWPDMYMSSSARLEGLGRVLQPVMSWRDPDVRAKMLAAWTGIAKGFLEQGDYPLELGEAMMRPEKKLSVNFEGRKITWLMDDSGQWVIDSNDKSTARFTAQLAEDVGLCDGIADTEDDLMFLLGYREYRKVPDSEKIVDDYIEDWRRTLEMTTRWATEYQDALRYATGEDTVKYLGQAKSALEKILAAMIKYEAVEIRWRMTQGEDRNSIQIAIEQIKEQIRSIRSAGRGGSVGGAGGGPGLGGGTGGGRPRR